MSSILPICQSTDSSQLDEGISENDSAFFSRGTNSKHSLSAVDPDSNCSISSNAAKDSRFDVSMPSATTENIEDDQESGFFKSDTPQQAVSDYESQSSSGIGNDSSHVHQSSISLPQSSSLEQLSVDMVNLSYKLTAVGLQSSHSDPSVYHSCADNSDSSMQCLGSGPSSGSQDDTSISAEFSFNCDRPDPEPILSSPEDTYEDEDEGVGIDGGGALASALAAPLSHTATQRLDLVTQGLDLNATAYPDSYSQFLSQSSRPYDDTDDWDREVASESEHKEWVRQVEGEQQGRSGAMISYPSSSSLHQTGIGEVEVLAEGIEVAQGLLGAEGLAEGLPEGLVGEEEFSSNLTAHNNHTDSASSNSTCLQSQPPSCTLSPPPPPPPPSPPPPPPPFSSLPSCSSAVNRCNEKSNKEDVEEEDVKRYFNAVISHSPDTEDRSELCRIVCI